MRSKVQGKPEGRENRRGAKARTALRLAPFVATSAEATRNEKQERCVSGELCLELTLIVVAFDLGVAGRNLIRIGYCRRQHLVQRRSGNKQSTADFDMRYIASTDGFVREGAADPESAGGFLDGECQSFLAHRSGARRWSSWAVTWRRRDA